MEDKIFVWCPAYFSGFASHDPDSQQVLMTFGTQNSVGSSETLMTHSTQKALGSSGLWELSSDNEPESHSLGNSFWC